MAKLIDYLEKINFRDSNFVGTITFKSEDISLPDGSKMALGIDDGHWVLVYQKKAGDPFQVFECDWLGQKIILDKKPGGIKEFATFRKLLKYFISEAKTEELVTILPPGGAS